MRILLDKESEAGNTLGIENCEQSQPNTNPSGGFHVTPNETDDKGPGEPAARPQPRTFKGTYFNIVEG